MARLATPISLGLSWPLTNPRCAIYFYYSVYIYIYIAPPESKILVAPENRSYSLLFVFISLQVWDRWLQMYCKANVETHDVDMKKKWCTYQVILCFTRDSTCFLSNNDRIARHFSWFLWLQSVSSYHWCQISSPRNFLIYSATGAPTWMSQEVSKRLVSRL